MAAFLTVRKFVLALCGLSLVGLACFPDVAVWDTMFHAMRLKGLAAELDAGACWPIPILSGACKGYGYAAPIFYCDLFLLPFAQLLRWGVPMSLCLTALLYVPMLLSGWMMWKMARWWGLDGAQARLCAFFYALSPMLMWQLFYAGQVGTLWSAVFTPCLLFPLTALLTEETLSKRRLLQTCGWLIVGATGTLFSHLISAYIACLVGALLVVLRLPFLVRHWQRLLALLCVGLATLLLTAIVWLPMVEQALGANLACFAETPDNRFPLTASVTTLSGMFLPPLFMNWGLVPRFGDFWFVHPDSFILWGWVLLPALWLLFRHRKSLASLQLSTGAKVLLLIACVIFLLVSVKPLLALASPLLERTQFTSRLSRLWLCALLPALTLFMTRLCSSRERKALLLGFLVAFGLALTVPLGVRLATYVTHSMPRASEKPFEIVRGEFLPANAKALAQEKGLYAFTKMTPLPIVEQDLTSPVPSAEVPKFYYVGYAATLNGEVCPVRESDKGLVEVETHNATGSLRVWYAGTSLQTLAGWISALSALLLAGLWAGLSIKGARGRS